MTNNQIMFFIFSAMIVVFSILTVTSRRILRAATFLLFVLVSTAGLYFMLRFNFLAAIQLTLVCRGYRCADHFLNPSDEPGRSKT
jgi:NADH-quinone oxidoreductase subunit J